MENEVEIRVAILEDQRVMRESLAEVLETNGCRVVSNSGDPASFLSRLNQEQATVAIVDLMLESEDGLSVVDGLNVLREIHQWHPDVKTLVLSASRSPQTIERCYQDGAAGYLYKLSATVESVVAAVKAVARGERLMPFQFGQPGSESRPAQVEQNNTLLSLTAREREVLGYIAGGADNLKIATYLKISERTVKAHVSSLYRKLGPENRAQLALLARQLGVRPPTGI
jgi:two-component system nitrate/nitrite response regulator NarL